MLADDDIRLVDALQVAPRASWAVVGTALGITAVTAARRWAALSEQGHAWVTAAPLMARNSPQCLAYIEITCRPEHRLTVANALAAHPLAVTVEITTGSADILLTAAAIDLSTMSHYLLHHLDRVEYILSTRARIATGIYGEGSAWRLRVLEPGVVNRLEQVRQAQLADDDNDQVAPLSEPVKTMLTDLAIDGRRSFVELAERAAISTSTARRHLARLQRSGAIVLRTDVNARAVGWPVQVYLWAEAPADKLLDTAAVLSRFRNARLTATVAAGPSLALCSWLRAVEEIPRLELAIAAKLPHVRVVDRLVVLRQVKRMGRLLDESGRAVGVVPINLWDDLLPHTSVSAS